MNKSKYTIRTSDRRVFRRCLRKWGWQSSLKGNFQKKGTEQNINFWFGSAIHYAMEDYFGYNRFGDPRKAFKAYYNAFDAMDLPDGAPEAYDLGIAMLTYFLDWYPRYNQQWGFETVWIDGKPAVEQKFYLDLGIKAMINKKTGDILGEYNPDDPRLRTDSFSIFDDVKQYHNLSLFIGGKDVPFEITPIYYHGTVDRIVKDKYGRYWILDYKTAKGADTNKLDTDDQISAYLWAAKKFFDKPIYGFIYLQLTKDIPRMPKRLKNGELSVDKKQKTTHYLLRQELIKDFGSVQKAPVKYIDFLNHLAEQENPEGDRFIRWDFVRRSDTFLEATGKHILGELKQMLDPDLYLYPNPTRDCIWDCPLRSACLALDDGRETEVCFMLENEYEKRPRHEDGKEDEWRNRIDYDIANEDADFLVDTENIIIVLPDEYND